MGVPTSHADRSRCLVLRRRFGLDDEGEQLVATLGVRERRAIGGRRALVADRALVAAGLLLALAVAGNHDQVVDLIAEVPERGVGLVAPGSVADRELGVRDHSDSDLFQEGQEAVVGGDELVALIWLVAEELDGLREHQVAQGAGKDQAVERRGVGRLGGGAGGGAGLIAVVTGHGILLKSRLLRTTAFRFASRPHHGILSAV